MNRLLPKLFQKESPAPLKTGKESCIIYSEYGCRAAVCPAAKGETSLLTEKELRKLRRAELLELLVEQSRIVDQLQKEVNELRDETARRKIGLEKAGSIAEASLRLTKVFEEAEEASKIYMENIEARSAEQDKINAARDEESRKKAEQLIMVTAKKCRDMEAATAQKCRQLLEQAKKRAEGQG